MGYSTWTLSGLTLNIEDVSSVQVPGTMKQKVSKQLVKHPVIGKNILDWELNCTGIFTGTNKDTDKAYLEALRNELTPIALVNGVHDGNYIVEDVSWEDAGDVAEGFYRYRIKLCEFNQ